MVVKGMCSPVNAIEFGESSPGAALVSGTLWKASSISAAVRPLRSKNEVLDSLVDPQTYQELLLLS